jgi:hypothetical protein
MDALPWYRPVVPLAPVDELPAFDALLCRRLARCVLCDQAVGDAYRIGVWAVAGVRVAFVCHLGCWQNGQAGPAVEAVLVARYGEG